ncbi:hypothetical protein UPYG_G00141430 [Umbra pygmaea]|uniref:Uncharacterized protein n=1 Tax=Umbra pygmaea TaxID=75934 RepID=A0ABD0XKD2_UMBPY
MVLKTIGQAQVRGSRHPPDPPCLRHHPTAPADVSTDGGHNQVPLMNRRLWELNGRPISIAGWQIESPVCTGNICQVMGRISQRLLIQHRSEFEKEAFIAL